MEWDSHMLGLKNMIIGMRAKPRCKACTEEKKLVDKEGKRNLK